MPTEPSNGILQSDLAGPALDDQIASLLKQVGERVRRIREGKHVSRRVLSEMSGVSPRYLAQLESGQGNISVGLLKRVALALDTPVEWFLSGSTGSDVARLFAAADPATQEAVMRMLGATPAGSARGHRICLIGLRGAGKSTLGRLAAEHLQIPFLELNDEIATYGGMPIEEIMALYGAEGYRTLEARALNGVVENNDRVLLAVAGGIVGEPRTYARLLQSFHTIWVKAAPQEHMDRVRAQGDERPMAGNPDAMEQLKSILLSREASYARAGAHLDTSGQSVDASLTDLLALIAERRFLA